MRAVETNETPAAASLAKELADNGGDCRTHGKGINMPKIADLMSWVPRDPAAAVPSSVDPRCEAAKAIDNLRRAIERFDSPALTRTGPESAALSRLIIESANLVANFATDVVDSLSQLVDEKAVRNV